MSLPQTAKPMLRAGVVLGVGLGGFADGILFHQLLQMHSMLTGVISKDTVPNIQINMFWDGVFHAFTWCMTLLGIILLFRAHSAAGAIWSGKGFSGSLLFGWGLFNLVEGSIDHHILHLHHVSERLGVSVFDYLFLISGVVLMVVGWITIRRTAPYALTQNEFE